jgi:hypothetical protein
VSSKDADDLIKKATPPMRRVQSMKAEEHLTTASAFFAPLICNPIGSPLLVKPHGTKNRRNCI